MNVTKINEHLKDHIEQYLFDILYYLYKEMTHTLKLCNIEMNCHLEHALRKTIDRNPDTIFKNKLITSIKHYIE